jgi:hypothetical protein
MCTVSWLHHPGGYDLFCNRDEKLFRARAEAPRVRVRRSVRCLAPQDPAGGGTWIGVNEFGVSLCLLNAYVKGRTGTESRGLLVHSLLHHRTSSEAVRAAYRTDLRDFAPFTLLAIEPEWPPRILTWDALHKIVLPDARSWNPLTSSSVDLDGATQRRRAAFPRRRDVDSLTAFHKSHAPRPGPRSVCMHRDDAETVSFSRIQVNGSRVQFDYTAGAPCTTDFCTRTTLRRTYADPARAFYAAC